MHCYVDAMDSMGLWAEQRRGSWRGGLSAEIQQMHRHSSGKGKSVGLREMKATCKLLKSGVGRKPGELDSEKIRSYSSISYIIFGEGLGIPSPPSCVPDQYFGDKIQ